MFRLSLKLSANRISPQVELIGEKEEQDGERDAPEELPLLPYLFFWGSLKHCRQKMLQELFLRTAT